MLKSELAERGVSMDPLGIEQAINQLWISHGERARGGAQALKTVGKIGLAVANAIRTHELPELPDMSVPEWLEPPPRAVYAVPQRDDSGHQWTAVHLDEGAPIGYSVSTRLCHVLSRSSRARPSTLGLTGHILRIGVVLYRCISASDGSACSTRRPPPSIAT
jgi:hypothetical protein